MGWFLEVRDSPCTFNSSRCAMESNRRTSFLYLLLLHLILSARADKYCASSRDTVRNVLISSETGIMEDRIIPRTDGVEVPPGGVSCHFRISVDQRDSAAVAVLSGFDVNKHVNNRRRAIRSAESAAPAAAMKYELSVPDSDATCSPPPTMSPRPVTLDMLRVLQLPRGSSMTVTYQLDSNNQSTPGMRIQVMEAGFCSRDITIFDHSCFMTSSTRRSLEAELTALSEDGTVMRLAAFSNSSVLHSFVRQSQRVRVGSGLRTRSKIPLNLTERHRIGMFYERSTGSVFYLSSAGPECQVELFEDLRELNLTVELRHQASSPVSCGSLRVVKPSSGGDAIGLVEFGDCGEPLPTLLSFAEATGNHCGNCTGAVLSWLETRPSDESPRGKGSMLLVLGITASIGLAVGLLAMIVLLRYRMSRSNPIGQQGIGTDKLEAPGLSESLKKPAAFQAAAASLGGSQSGEERTSESSSDSGCSVTSTSDGSSNETRPLIRDPACSMEEESRLDWISVSIV